MIEGAPKSGVGLHLLYQLTEKYRPCLRNISQGYVLRRIRGTCNVTITINLPTIRKLTPCLQRLTATSRPNGPPDESMLVFITTKIGTKPYRRISGHQLFLMASTRQEYHVVTRYHCTALAMFCTHSSLESCDQRRLKVPEQEA